MTKKIIFSLVTFLAGTYAYACGSVYSANYSWNGGKIYLSNYDAASFAAGKLIFQVVENYSEYHDAYSVSITAPNGTVATEKLEPSSRCDYSWRAQFSFDAAAFTKDMTKNVTFTFFDSDGKVITAQTHSVTVHDLFNFGLIPYENERILMIGGNDMYFRHRTLLDGTVVYWVDHMTAPNPSSGRSPQVIAKWIINSIVRDPSGELSELKGESVEATPQPVVITLDYAKSVVSINGTAYTFMKMK
jgi:hypothetical protein